MNTNDTRFDRLVDDELDEEERRALLAGLDDEPDGWRRCALAFLEAQCWKKAFDELRNPLEHTSLVAPAKRQPSRFQPWHARFRVAAAMAASFLLALWLGGVAYRAWLGRENPAAPAEGEVASAPVQPVAPTAAPETSPGPWRVVRVSAPSIGGAPAASFDLPAVERDKLDDQWAASVPPAVPDNVMQALERLGHQVCQERELVPIPLNGGRKVVVPVDKVNVRYVGNKVY